MLLDIEKNIKIVDFGLSNTYSELPAKSVKKKESVYIEDEEMGNEKDSVAECST